MNKQLLIDIFDFLFFRVLVKMVRHQMGHHTLIVRKLMTLKNCWRNNYFDKSVLKFQRNPKTCKHCSWESQELLIVRQTEKERDQTFYSDKIKKFGHEIEIFYWLKKKIEWLSFYWILSNCIYVIFISGIKTSDKIVHLYRTSKR